MPSPSTAAPLITVHETAHGGEYRAHLAGVDAAGKLTWIADGQRRIVNHTHVPPQLRGHGIAALLVDRLVEDARAQGFGIVPQCSYVAALFDRHPEWADLLA